MFTFLTRKNARLTAALLRRAIAALAVAAGGVLAWAAGIPAASAAVIPVPGPAAGFGPVSAAPSSPVQAIVTGGTPGWQITLIAVAAALVAAPAAVMLDRTRASHQAASTVR